MKKPIPTYEYFARLMDVVDGDTVDVQVELGFYVSQSMRMRLNGIDTMEMNSKDATERFMARQAKELLEQYLGRECVVRSHKKDKYGRFLCDLYVFDGADKEELIDINKMLLDSGLAVAYDGGRRG